MAICEAKELLMHLLMHDIKWTYNKYHAFLYGQVLDDVLPSVKITHTCYSGLIVLVTQFFYRIQCLILDYFLVQTYCIYPLFWWRPSPWALDHS